MKISDDKARENCPSEGAIDLHVFLRGVAIRHGAPDAKDDWPVKYQD
jgi:hypothetical protein